MGYKQPTAHVAKLSIREMSTEALKEKLGDFESLYKDHNTGSQNHRTDLLFGERQGIIDWCLQEGWITDYGMQGEWRHFAMTKTFLWFEEKLDMLRELNARRQYAEQMNHSGQLGYSQDEVQKDRMEKLANIKQTIYQKA